MPETTSSLIRQAIEILRKSLEETNHETLTPQQRALDEYNREFLMLEIGSDISCAEMLEMFNEAAQKGFVSRMEKAEFLLFLKGSMRRVFGVGKSHNIRREGRRVRGFKGIGPRSIGEAPTAADLEPPIEPELVLDPPDLDLRPTKVDPTVPTVIDDGWAVRL